MKNPLARKTATAPSIEDRALTASIDAEVALGIFGTAAQSLEAAAIELEDISSESHIEADRLRQLGQSAGDEARHRRTQASAIRNLISGNLTGVAL